MADPFLGEIKAVGFPFAPEGWAVCNGAMIAIQQNSALFALLGTLYGGNGTTNFGLPDLRSRVIIGTGQGTGLSNYPQGAMGGTETINTSAVLSAANMPQHTHTANASTLTSTGTVTINCNDTAGTQTTADQAYFGKANAVNNKATYDANVYNTTAPNKTMNSGTATFAGSIGGSVTIAPSGNAYPTPISIAGDNRLPYLSLLYIIATTGIFPTRP